MRCEPATPDDPGYFIRWLIAQPRTARMAPARLFERAAYADRQAQHDVGFMRSYWRDQANSLRLWAAVIFAAPSVRVYQTGVR